MEPLFFNSLPQPLHGQSAVTFSTIVRLSQKSNHQKLDKKKGKNRILTGNRIWTNAKE